MSSNATDLLRLLGSQAVPGVAPIPGAPQGPAQGIDFARLLSQAREGQLASGREVKIAEASGLNLTDDQMKRLSAAADLAESQGATRALVMMDGMTFSLDVAMREVTGTVDLKNSSVLTGIDSVIQVPSDASRPVTLPLPKAGADNSTLLGILSRRDRPHAA